MLQSHLKREENNRGRQKEGRTWMGEGRSRGKGEQDQMWGNGLEISNLQRCEVGLPKTQGVEILSVLIGDDLR